MHLCPIFGLVLINFTKVTRPYFILHDDKKNKNECWRGRRQVYKVWPATPLATKIGAKLLKWQLLSALVSNHSTDCHLFLVTLPWMNSWSFSSLFEYYGPSRSSKTIIPARIEIVLSFWAIKSQADSQRWMPMERSIIATKPRLNFMALFNSFCGTLIT